MTLKLIFTQRIHVSIVVQNHRLDFTHQYTPKVLIVHLWAVGTHAEDLRHKPHLIHAGTLFLFLLECWGGYLRSQSFLRTVYSELSLGRISPGPAPAVCLRKSSMTENKSDLVKRGPPNRPRRGGGALNKILYKTRSKPLPFYTPFLIECGYPLSDTCSVTKLFT